MKTNVTAEKLSIKFAALVKTTSNMCIVSFLKPGLSNTGFAWQYTDHLDTFQFFICPRVMKSIRKLNKLIIKGAISLSILYYIAEQQ